MASIDLVGISHRYEGAKTWALENLEVGFADGAAHALLGPSGCGKTTILNLVSGLITPTKGAILLSDREVTSIQARERGIAQVFQFPVVYEGLSVQGNLEFPLKNAGVDRVTRRQRVAKIAELLDLGDVLGRKAAGLSQALKQKVSLGRGLVREDTHAVLLDEPLTVIDPEAKHALRRKLKQVQKALKMTMIYVTHDQHEALTFADIVTVMDHGCIVQQGTPEDLYARPATPFVAKFIGSPGMNLIPCDHAKQALHLDAWILPIPAELSRRLPPGALQLGLRPEAFEIKTEKPTGAAIPGIIRQVLDRGSHRQFQMSVGGVDLCVRAPSGTALTADQSVWLNFPLENAVFFADGQRVNLL